MKDYKNPIKATMNKAKDNLLDIADSIYQQGYEAGKADTPFTDTEEAEEKAYNRGLSDAWELVKRIESTPEDDGLTNEQIVEVFGQYWSSFELYRAFSVEEAMDLMKAYEDKQTQDDWRDIPSDEMTLEQARRAVKELRAEVLARLSDEDKQKQDAEIKVGDEVEFDINLDNNNKGIVTRIIDTRINKKDVVNAYILWNDGSCGLHSVTVLKKTGHTHPQIVEVLAELRGAENADFTD